MSVSELIVKLIKLIKANPQNIKRLVKLIGFAAFIIIWYKFRGCRAHDNVVMMPQWNKYVGHFPEIFKHWHDLNYFSYDLAKRAKYPSVGAFSSFTPWYIIVIFDPDLVKFIFDTKFESFKKGDKISNELYELLGDGIFASDPPRWKFHRKIASRMFSMRNLKNYMFDCTVLHTKKVIDKINEKQCDNNNIDIYDMLSRFTLDCFTSIAFGKSVDSLPLYPKLHPFAEAFDNLMATMAIRHFVPPWLWKTNRLINSYLPFNFGNEGRIKRDVAIINAFSDQVLDSRENVKKNIKSISDESGSKTHDVLSLFMQHSDKELTRQQLKHIAMNMIIAGRDTTRLLLSWFLYEMCKRPEIKAKVYKEIDEYGSDEITYDNIITSLFYLESVLLETLRMNPVVPFLVRIAQEDVELPNGNIIRQGNEVIIPTYAFGRNAKIYPNPLEFDPNRFYQKDGKVPIKVKTVYEYPYFNINPRLCLGRALAIMEMKVFVFYFLKQFNFEMADPNQKIKIKTGIVLNMENGLRLKLTNRQ